MARLLLFLEDRWAALGGPFRDRLAAVRRMAANWAPTLRARLGTDR